MPIVWASVSLAGAIEAIAAALTVPPDATQEVPLPQTALAIPVGRQAQKYRSTWSFTNSRRSNATDFRHDHKRGGGGLKIGVGTEDAARSASGAFRTCARSRTMAAVGSQADTVQA